MEWIDEVKNRIKRGRIILFDRDSQPVAALYERLCVADRRAVVIWALYFAESCALRLKELGERDQAKAFDAILAAKMWAAGDIKMPEAKRAILDCHAAAKEAQCAEAAALYRAVGQACSAVHTPRHAPGLYVYELTAYVLRYGVDGCKGKIEERAAEYLSRLENIEGHIGDYDFVRAKFLSR